MLLSEARPRPYRQSEFDRRAYKDYQQQADTLPSKDFGIDALRKHAEWHQKYGKSIVNDIDNGGWSVTTDSREAHQKNPMHSVDMHANNKMMHYFMEYYNGISWKEYRLYRDYTNKPLGGHVNVMLISSYHDSFDVIFSAKTQFYVNKAIDIDQQLEDGWRVYSESADHGRTKIIIELDNYNRYEMHDCRHTLFDSSPEASKKFYDLLKLYTDTNEYDYIYKEDDGKELDLFTHELDSLGDKENTDARDTFEVMKQALNKIIAPTVNKIERKLQNLKLHVSQNLSAYAK